MTDTDPQDHLNDEARQALGEERQARRAADARLAEARAKPQRFHESAEAARRDGERAGRQAVIDEIAEERARTTITYLGEYGYASTYKNKGDDAA